MSTGERLDFRHTDLAALLRAWTAAGPDRRAHVRSVAPDLGAAFDTAAAHLRERQARNERYDVDAVQAERGHAHPPGPRSRAVSLTVELRRGVIDGPLRPAGGTGRRRKLWGES